MDEGEMLSMISISERKHIERQHILAAVNHNLKLKDKKYMIIVTADERRICRKECFI